MDFSKSVVFNHIFIKRKHIKFLNVKTFVKNIKILMFSLPIKNSQLLLYKMNKDGAANTKHPSSEWPRGQSAGLSSMRPGFEY